MNIPILTENTQNLPFLHVKRENTRKIGVKMVENTLFSQIDKVLQMYPRLDVYISFPFFPGSRTGNKPLCDHILVSSKSKGNQIYCINLKRINELIRKKLKLIVGSLYLILMVLDGA